VAYATSQCLRVGQTGLFDECLHVVGDWRTYRDWCIKDACVSPTNGIVCTMIAALAYRCAGRHVIVDWMSDSETASYCQGWSLRSVYGSFDFGSDVYRQPTCRPCCGNKEKSPQRSLSTSTHQYQNFEDLTTAQYPVGMSNILETALTVRITYNS
jgi:hypothetical protein